MTRRPFPSILNPMIHNRNPWRFFTFLLLGAILLLSACDPSASIGRQLKRLGLTWESDTEGDFRVTVPLEEIGRDISVGISAHAISLSKDVWVREIWSVAARIPGDLPMELAENLMRDSWSSRKFGSWAIAGTTSDGRQVIVYLARIPADASRKLLEAAIMDTAASAADLNLALANLDVSE